MADVKLATVPRVDVRDLHARGVLLPRPAPLQLPLTRLLWPLPRRVGLAAAALRRLPGGSAVRRRRGGVHGRRWLRPGRRACGRERVSL